MDRVAVKNWANGLNIGSGSFDQFTLEMFTLGAGALPVIGAAEQVAEKLKRLYDLGMDGLLACFLNYYEDTVRFGREIVSLLQQMGVVSEKYSTLGASAFRLFGSRLRGHFFIRERGHEYKHAANCSYDPKAMAKPRGTA